jgi:hypothetical protein
VGLARPAGVLTEAEEAGPVERDLDRPPSPRGADAQVERAGPEALDAERQVVEAIPERHDGRVAGEPGPWGRSAGHPSWAPGGGASRTGSDSGRGGAAPSG